jgi:membrane protease YdiL (CAAX protease family)
MTNDATLGTPSSAVPPPPLPDETPQPIAHWAHTLGLLGVLALTTIYGHHRAASVPSNVSHVAHYAMTGALEWLLLAGVIAGIYRNRRREFLLRAFGNRAFTWGQALGFGIMVYLIGLVTIAAVGIALSATPLVHEHNLAYLLAMLPRSPLEFLLWFGVSLTAGLCEELIFRGYLLQQLTAWTRMPIASIVIAALLFGSVHLYEGLGAILPLAALAVVYGFVVRHFKGDLRAVIVAHTLQDFLVGFIALAKPIVEQHAPRS